MKDSRVSVIVTTRNNASTLDACLRSIVDQSYENIELLVIDNNSRDNTKDIAKNYTKLVFDKGPERSTQRNFGVHKAKGSYILIIDSDMELTKNVVADCVKQTAIHPEAKALIIPEESFGEGFWAQCKRLERSFYIGQDDIEAARFFEKSLYEQVGGYDETMVGGEDWDLSQRMREYTTIGRVSALIMHNEGRFSLHTALKKKFYYTKGFMTYYDKHKTTSSAPSASALKYYKLYLSRPGKLFQNPVYGFGVLFMKTCEFGAAALGYFGTKINAREEA